MPILTVTDIISIARCTIRLESEAIAGLLTKITDDFEKAVLTILESKGRVIISGIGKSAIIAQKIVATFNSIGTPSIFLHAADAMHGDLGMVQQQDVVMIISNSGESPEIKALLPFFKNFGNKLIGMVGNPASLLALEADIVLKTTVSQEACHNNLAPTSSTTAQLVMGDALAMALIEIKGFGNDHFVKFYPGRISGKKLYLRVSDLYVFNEKPMVEENASLKEVIVEISSKRVGATAVVDSENRCIGIITDGDLRRMLGKNIPLESVGAADIMTRNPKTVTTDQLAVDALDIMRKEDISQLVVKKNKDYLGILHLHDLIREGLI